MLKKLLAGVVGLSLFGGVAAVAQLFPNFPIAGGPSYSCGSVNGVSNCTVPAGPSLSGDEFIPADTYLSQGRTPQTVKVPILALGGGAMQLASPLTGTTVTIADGTGTLLVTPAGTIAALTVQLPAAAGLFDGQILKISTSQIITAATYTAGSGTSVIAAPAGFAAIGTGHALVYRAANTSWYPLY